MRRSLLLLSALLLLAPLAAACGDDNGSTGDDEEGFDPPSTSEDGAPPDVDDLAEGAVVFSPDDVATDSFDNETTWTPSVEDVEAADELLQVHIDDHPELGLEDDDVDAHLRQYLGTGPAGDIVSVNALCEDAGLDGWEDDLVLVNDGGPCFWQAEVSLPTRHVPTFTLNGDA